MKLDFDLGQMKSENGAALRYKVEELASSLAFVITQNMRKDQLSNGWMKLLTMKK